MTTRQTAAIRLDPEAPNLVDASAILATTIFGPIDGGGKAQITALAVGHDDARGIDTSAYCVDHNGYTATILQAATADAAAHFLVFGRPTSDDLVTLMRMSADGSFATPTDTPPPSLIYWEHGKEHLPPRTVALTTPALGAGTPEPRGTGTPLVDPPASADDPSPRFVAVAHPIAVRVVDTKTNTILTTPPSFAEAIRDAEQRNRAHQRELARGRGNAMTLGQLLVSRYEGEDGTQPAVVVSTRGGAVGIFDNGRYDLYGPEEAGLGYPRDVASSRGSALAGQVEGIALGAESVRAELSEAARSHDLTDAEAATLQALPDGTINAAIRAAVGPAFWDEYDHVRRTAIASLAAHDSAADTIEEGRA